VSRQCTAALAVAVQGGDGLLARGSDCLEFPFAVISSVIVAGDAGVGRGLWRWRWSAVSHSKMLCAHQITYGC
jgi:hypothetical protein